jgi:NADH-quinone oxidoreductase subunit C
MSDTTEAEPQALPGDGLREGIIDELRRHLGEALVETELKPNDDLWVRVATDSWKAAGEALLSMGFEYFCFLSALDWMPSPYGRGEDDPTEPPPERPTEIRQGVAGGATRFQVFARVTDIHRHVGVTLKVDVPDDTMAIESWFTVYAGANWHERETHEMFGIGFAGHPDLRNMYLPTEFEGYPLRKDFPLLARMVKPWPGIVDVEPMPAEEQLPQDEVVGSENPVDATPDQADAGLGVPPAEDLAEEAAEKISTGEAPNSSTPPEQDPTGQEEQDA